MLELVKVNLELANLRSLSVAVADDESPLCSHQLHDGLNGQNLQETQLRIKRALSFSSERGSLLLTKILACDNLNRLALEVQISKFPQYEEHFLQGLAQLMLYRTEIEEVPMEILEKLPQLRYLEFSIRSYVGTDLICHELGFPQPRNLILDGMPNLSRWRVNKGGMPNLSCLEIRKCLMLEMIPEGLKYVAGLKELIIERMPPTFVDRIKIIDDRGGEDFDKIQHIPSITIQ